MKAVFTGIPAYIEQDLLESGYEIEEIQKLINHKGDECGCNVACYVDDDFESNYYILTFEDGFKFDNLSGRYLERI